MFFVACSAFSRYHKVTYFRPRSPGPEGRSPRSRTLKPMRPSSSEKVSRACSKKEGEMSVKS